MTTSKQQIMNMHMNRYFAAIFALPLATLSFAGEELRLPDPISGLVTKAMEIKTEAMKLPAMRSEDGELGKKAENIMDQIAEVADAEIAERAQQTQEHDIRAKIILWALDRKNRLAEYERFAKLYLNRPIGTKEAVEYFSRPPNGETVEPDPFAEPGGRESIIPRPGTWQPHSIDKEDIVEANRFVMEYCFFMPPKGGAFDRENSRYNLMVALIALGNTSKTYGVFTEDAEIWFEYFKDLEIPENYYRPRHASNGSGWTALNLLPSKPSFERLARYCVVPSVMTEIQQGFTNLWGWPWPDMKPTPQQNHQEWMELAKQDWPKPEEREFARLLSSIPAPQPAVKPSDEE